MHPITIIQFAVRVGAYVRTNTDAPLHVYMGDVWVVSYVKYTVIAPPPYIIPWHELV